ncbi:MAG: shikimate dehydrogenase [Anaerolineae bacterium]
MDSVEFGWEGRLRCDIDARTKLVGVMGWPVEHSLSPAMHNAALRMLSINWRYVALPVPPAWISEAVHGVTALGFRGVNVTVPHKRSVLPLLDYVAPDAEALGAANTLVIDRDADGVSLTGHNTDVDGFLGSLRDGGFEPAEGGKAVVVGAGGAARAVVYGLLKGGLDEVIVLNRTPARVRALAEDLQAAVAEEQELHTAVLSEETLIDGARAADLLVNATTLGMWPAVQGSVWPEDVPVPAHLVVYDLVYNPLETQLLRQARAAGAHGIDGLGMLARQGALALSYWLDTPIDVESVGALMRQVCLDRLRESRLGSNEPQMVE